MLTIRLKGEEVYGSLLQLLFAKNRTCHVILPTGILVSLHVCWHNKRRENNKYQSSCQPLINIWTAWPLRRRRFNRHYLYNNDTSMYKCVTNVTRNTLARNEQQNKSVASKWAPVVLASYVKGSKEAVTAHGYYWNRHTNNTAAAGAAAVIVFLRVSTRGKAKSKPCRRSSPRVYSAPTQPVPTSEHVETPGGHMPKSRNIVLS